MQDRDPHHAGFIARILRSVTLSDTVRLLRPTFERRRREGSGRIEHDSRGNAVLKRTRAGDSEDMTVDASLEIVDDGRGHGRKPRPRTVR